MFATTRRDPSAVQRTISESKLRWLGRAPDGYDYAEHGGKEYAVDIHLSPDPGDYVRQPGEILVMRVHRELIDGSPFEHHGTHRAFEVAPGTYASLAVKADRRPVEKPMRAWDALSTLPALTRREPTRIATVPPASLPEVGLLKTLMGAKADPGIIEFGGHQPPERTPAGIIAYLERRGVELSLARGRLLARSRNPIRFDDRELIEKAAELIVGHLRGSPVLCSLCAESAVTIAYPDAPMCTAHLGGPRQ